MRTIRLLLLTLLTLSIPAGLFAQFGVSITIAPPALPVYEQPMAPADGYLWTPGYWSYGEDGYFWVPGTWVMAPEPGLLWTPGYWGWGSDAYAWNEGYWGPQVGFYGGVNYGYGYGGSGYGGGYWNKGAFYYNRSVNNVNVTNIHNVYNKTVINTTTNHVSFNGGRGGISARPSAAQETAAHERHTPPTSLQTQHVHAASGNHALLASVNHGRPAIAATAKPAEFSGHGVVAAKQAGAPYKVAENKPAGNKSTTRTDENKAAANKIAKTRPGENKTAESKAAAPRTNSNKPAENRTATTRTNGSRPAENNKPTAAHERPASHPATAAHAQPAPRQQPAPRAEPRPQGAPHAAAAQHEQPAPRQQPAPRAEAAPRPQSAPHTATAAHAQPAPRPAKETPKAAEHPHK